MKKSYPYLKGRCDVLNGNPDDPKYAKGTCKRLTRIAYVAGRMAGYKEVAVTTVRRGVDNTQGDEMRKKGKPRQEKIDALLDLAILVLGGEEFLARLGWSHGETKAVYAAIIRELTADGALNETVSKRKNE